MVASRSLAAGKPRRLAGRVSLIVLASLSLLGAEECGEVDPTPSVTPPSVSVTLNAVPDDMNDLLVVAASGFVVNVSWQANTYPINPDVRGLWIDRWGSAPGSQQIFEVPLKSDGTGAVGIIGGSLAIGSYTLRTTIGDTQGNVGYVDMAFAVRGHGVAPPIGVGQQIWLDFESDRDAVPGADFPVDLQAFGLGSVAAPQVSAFVLAEVIDAVLARVEEVYYDQPSSGLEEPDPVEVAFSSTNPGSGDVTRICIGGQGAGGSIGSILIDPKNANRNSVECATLPPTGIFPRGLLILSGEAAFQQVFNPLMTATGGVPAGEHPLDATVLAPGFDPATASPEQLARYQLVQAAVQGFADMLGSIVAHETGHALGLVPGGPPGGGLYGGTSGATLNHDVTPAGASPTENFLMNAGNTFTFARLAGLQGNPLPYFRPLDYAYLRDRVVIDPAVTVLAFPPVLGSIAPNTISSGTYTQVSFLGTGFLPTPVIRALRPDYTYNVTGESLVSSSEVKGWVNYGQILPGVYDIELRNPDGQLSLLPGALTIIAP